MGLLKRNPPDRMSFDEFFNHPFLQGTRMTPSPVSAELSVSPRTMAIPEAAPIIDKSEPETSSPCSSPEDDFVLVPSDLSSDADNNPTPQPVK